MKCHLCVNYIEMQTDPATCDYVIVSGARRKEERWDMAENEQILTTERMEKEKLETDAMFKLDHGRKDKAKLAKALPSLSEIQDHQAGWKDDFQLNSFLRRKFRTEKKVQAEQEEKDDAVRMRTNLSIPLLPERKQDKELAALLTYQAPDSYDDNQHSKRKAISSRSWFTSTSMPPGGAAGSLLHKLRLQGKDAAVAKALGSSHCPLIRRRTEGSGAKAESSAAALRRKSDPELSTWDDRGGSEVTQREEEPHLVIQSDREETQSSDFGSRESRVGTREEAGTEPAAAEDCGKERERRSGGVASLVADYSDSNSEPGQ
ncbi:putative splicing factor YJU2B [Genypterus blacodes]|uniref:putative splicing factor YJU2B n=1 Tax=Genypterus blacodes TaxID=154954 RepID=UPI003F772DBE